MCEQIEFTRASHHQHVRGGRTSLATVTRLGALLWAKCAFAKLRYNKALRYPRLCIATVCLFNAKLQNRAAPSNTRFSIKYAGL